MQKKAHFKELIMKVNITPASKKLMPVIQNMARFYAYDLSKSCGFYELFDWSVPEDGLYLS